MVGGQFSDDGGRPSGYIRKLYDAMRPFSTGTLINGGHFSDLSEVLPNLKSFPVIFWMPSIPNDKEKLVDRIKIESPRSILVTSKNNLDSRYSFLELIARALRIKSNLFVEFVNPENNPHEILANIYDPLGNCFCSSKDINKVAFSLISRVYELCRFTRAHSIREDNLKVRPKKAPEEFFSVIKHCAEIFHGLIYPHSSRPAERFLGNASFRCLDGFPSFRSEGNIFVSRRNIDKRSIGMEGFVQTALLNHKGVTINYVGEHKPSVDTPIQLLLYRYYPKMNFMMHSHTYIQGALYTENIIPCGAIEEFFEITKIFPDQDEDFIKINLKGHGSLVMTENLKYLILPSAEYTPMPERFGYLPTGGGVVYHSRSLLGQPERHDKYSSYYE